MTAPKEGDRVRVEVEAVVEYERMDGLLWVRTHGKEGPNRLAVSPDACTVLAPPIKEGDVITDAAQLGALPVGSIVAEPKWSPLWKVDGGWVSWSGVSVRAPTAGSFTVLRIGDGKA